MTETIDAGGATIHVTPISELLPYQAMTAAIILGRFDRASGDGDTEAMGEAACDLLYICSEDGIRRETIHDLEPDQLLAIMEVVVPDAAEMDDPDADASPGQEGGADE